MKSVVRTIPQPSRSEVLEKLGSLAAGEITREQASSWAGYWLVADNVPGTEVEVSDLPAWEGLKLLASADLAGWDRPFLYNEEDFRGWSDELRAAPR
jgi:hypothetical protein